MTNNNITLNISIWPDVWPNGHYPLFNDNSIAYANVVQQVVIVNDQTIDQTVITRNSLVIPAHMQMRSNKWILPMTRRLTKRFAAGREWGYKWPTFDGPALNLDSCRCSTDRISCDIIGTYITDTFSVSRCRSQGRSSFVFALDFLSCEREKTREIAPRFVLYINYIQYITFNYLDQLYRINYAVLSCLYCKI